SLVVWDDIYPMVDEAIAALPDDLRVALIAAYLEGQPHRAIAKSLGVPRRTVTYRIAKAVDSLRAALVRRGVPVGAAVFASTIGARMAEAAPPSLLARLGRIALSGAGMSTGQGA